MIFMLFLFFLVYNNFIMISFFLCFLLFYIMNNNYFYFLGGLMHFDYFTMIFLIILILVSSLIFRYSKWYFEKEIHNKVFLLLMMLFSIFMFLFVSFNSILFMMLSWESISLISYLLIFWWCSRSEASLSANQAVMYNRVGDLSLYLFISFIMIFSFSSNSLELMNSYWFYLLLFSIMAKSSLFFFHPWLPNAMESPTPVSSLLHSSTMVVASVFLLINFMKYLDSDKIMIMSFIGSLTMIYSSISSLSQSDLKKIIAFSTTSQLSFMILACCIVSSKITMMLLFFHSFFKSLLFMVSSMIIHNFNSNQTYNKVSLISSLFVNFSFFLSCLSLMGIPFFTSFFSKELILENIWSSVFNSFVFIIFFLGCILTVAYSTNLMFLNKKFFLPKILSSEKLSYNLLWLVILSLLSLIFSSYLVFFYIKNEQFSYLFMKFFVLSVFILGFFFNMMKIKFLNFYLSFYNPLVHRMIQKFNNLFKMFNLMEFFWMEIKINNLKILPKFFGFKLLFFLIFIFVIFLSY